MRSGLFLMTTVAACGAYEAPSGEYRIEELTLSADTCGWVEQLPGAEEDLSDVQVEWFGAAGGLQLELGTVSLPCTVDGPQFECLPSVTQDTTTEGDDYALHETLMVVGRFKRGSDALKLTYTSSVTCSGAACADYVAANELEMPCTVTYDALAMPR